MAGTTSDDLNEDDTTTINGATVVDPSTDEVIEPAPGEVVGDAVEVEGEGGVQDDEVVVTLEGEQQPADDEDHGKAPQWVKDLRKSNREKDRALREKDAEIARLKGGGTQQAAPTLGPKPTLSSCDFDEAAFEAQLEEWHATKRKIDDAAKAEQDARAAQQAAWEKKLKAHDEGRQALRVPDFDDAAANVEEAFSVVQRGILIDCAQNSAALQYALGKNPAKLKELAAIQNPAHFTWALAQLETKLKVEAKRTAPPAERVIRGSGSLAGTTDKVLEQLRAEADRTGDRTKVTKYLRDKKNKG